MLISPAGETLIEVDGPDGAHGPERFSVLAATPAEAGRFRLAVESRYPEEPAGELTVTLAGERAARPEDRELLTAERLSNEAVAHWGRGDGESLRTAVARFEEALEVWRRLGDRRREAEITTHLGYLQRQLGDLRSEVERYEQALPLWRELGEAERQAELLNNLGLAYGRLGDVERGIAASEEAAALFHELGDRRSEGAALNTIGSAYLSVGRDLDRAQDYLERSLALRRETGDRRGEGRTLNGLARVDRRRGRIAEAIATFRQALEIARAVSDREAELVALNNLSTTFDEIGEPERSLEHYQELLRLSREQGDLRGEAFALNNIGALYAGLGEVDDGISYLRQALDLFVRVGERFAEATALDAIGAALLTAERPVEAKEYIVRAVAAARALDDPVRESWALGQLARSHSALGDDEAGRAAAEEAIVVADASGLRPNQAFAQRTLAHVLLEGDQPAAALVPLSRALSIDVATGNRPDEAQSLILRARALHALGRLDEARRDYEASVELVESIRTAVTAQHLRATYLATKQQYYEEWISVLMALDRDEPEGGWAARALTVAERARARTLLDALAEVRGEVRNGLEPELSAEEQRLRHQLNAREIERQQAVAAGHDAAAVAAAQAIQTLTADYRALEARIRTTNPRYAGLVLPEPLDAPGVQAILGPGTLLLQYSLGQEASWLWAVTEGSLQAFELAPRERIEGVARKLYDQLTARNREPDGETAEQRGRRISEADAAFPQTAAELTALLLEPARTALARQGVERVVLVADGALHYVPFAALPAPRSGQPLLEEFELVNVPSASVLDALRHEHRRREADRVTLAVIADPVFDAADPRVAAARLEGERSQIATTDADGGGLRGGSYRRLRFSRREADLISGLVPPGNRLTALDFAASRDTVTGGALAGYRMIHFATHGVLNTDYPALSGLVLSLVDESGKPHEGFLRLHDIYDLHLDADLVTLSACETALGREIRGEGLVGLARGFMYAGASRVVASLWSVQDRATAETMHRFYTAMLERGSSPAAALREAQISMAQEERWSAPYYWAPFLLHGEWQ